MDKDVQAGWARVRGLLRASVGESTYRNWLKPLTLVECVDGTVRLSLPTRFMRDWVANHFGERLTELWIGDDAPVSAVEIFVLAGKEKTRVAEPRVLEAADAGLRLNRKYKFENFVVGKPNEFAYAAARRVSDSPAANYNPLFLYGASGLGKTHLMHAIAWQIHTQRPDDSVVILSAERFMEQFVRALKAKEIMAFKERFRSVDVLMIDDVHFIGGKEATQEEFFHTFNDLMSNGRQVVVSAGKPPSSLEGVEERLRSRFGCGLVADIAATTYDLRLRILQAKAEAARLDVSEKVLEFLAHEIATSVRELEGALNRVAAQKELIGRDITLDNCREILRDLLRPSERRVTIEEIQKRVAAHFNIRVADMHSARRSRAIARPRQVAMYLSKQLTTRSLPEIGRKFGGRDHTTVIHAVRKIEELRTGDEAFAEDVDLLRRMLEGD